MGHLVSEGPLNFWSRGLLFYFFHFLHVMPLAKAGHEGPWQPGHSNSCGHNENKFRWISTPFLHNLFLVSIFNDVSIDPMCDNNKETVSIDPVNVLVD